MGCEAFRSPCISNAVPAEEHEISSDDFPIRCAHKSVPVLPTNVSLLTFFSQTLINIFSALKIKSDPERLLKWFNG
jgi:hypothetical protein